MMKIYFQPNLEVIKLTQNDVLCTSDEPTPPVVVGDNFQGLKEGWDK